MAADILTNYQHVISEFTFITGSKGAFELKVNDELIYSKKQLGRHAQPGEILGLFEQFIGPGIERYPRD